MKQTINVTKSHLINRTTAFLVPIFMMVTAAVIAVLLQIVLRRFDFIFDDPDFTVSQAGQGNTTIVWMLASFLVYLGVASVSMRFPFALSLGSTRSSFALGTLLYHVLQAAYVAILIMVLLSIELLTGHWFSDMYIFDVYTLGAGHIGWAGIIMFLLCLTAMSIGGIFGATWLRFKNKGPILLASICGIVIIGTLLVISPALPNIVEHFQLWWLSVASLTIIGLAVIGEYMNLRGASIR